MNVFESCGSRDKEPTCQCRRHKGHGLDPWVGKISWMGKWQPTPIFLPGESPWTEKPGGLRSIGLHRVRHNWSDLAHMHTLSVYESHSVVSDSLGPHGLYSPGNSPFQNTGVGSHSFLQWIFPTQVSHFAGGFFTSWATREAYIYRGSICLSDSDLYCYYYNTGH